MQKRSLWIALAVLSLSPIRATAGPAEDFWTAFQNQNVTAMDAALAKGASVDSRGEQGMTALIMAAAAGRLETVKKLLDHGANPNAEADATLGGMTAIEVAAGKGAVEVMNLLLDKGAAIEGRSLAAFAPIDYAASQGQTRSIALLYARGASVTAPNRME